MLASLKEMVDANKLQLE